jgi:hypothetical protein
MVGRQLYIVRLLALNDLNQPGVHVPLGVREEATGGTQRAHRGTQNLRNLTQMKLIWVEFFIWGYAKGMGVCRGVQFRFGGT